MMKLNSYFDKIYCINLMRRPDRWAEMEAMFENFSIEDVKRIEAVDGDQLTQFYNPITKNEAACIMSTMLVFDDAIKNGHSQILIMEDDAEFMTAELNEYLLAIPDDWDAIYFGGNHMHEGKPDMVNDKVARIRKTYTSHCIGFRNNNDFFRTILNTIKPYKKQVDVYYIDLQKTHNIYCFNPAVVTQRPSFSDITKTESGPRSALIKTIRQNNKHA